MLRNYELLAKYFAQETSPEEDAIVEQYKKDHPEEYQRLYELWTAKLAEVRDYDSTQAWQKVKLSATKPAKNNIRSLRWISYAAAVLVLLFAVTQIFAPNQDASPLQWVSNDTADPMDVFLPDSTKVILASNAKIGYPLTFESNKRNVSAEGNIFFDVRRDTSKPFVISADHASVEVLGTSFSVENTSLTTAVTVATGMVRVSPNSSDAVVILRPGDKAVASDTNIEKSSETDVNFASKYTGRFEFDHMPIEDAIAKLNEYYTTSIALQTDQSTCHLTSAFADAPIEEVVAILSRTCNLKSTKTNTGYVLQK